MPMLGPWELIIILAIVVVIFGAGRLSEIGGAMGKSIKEFRKATTDDQHATSAQPPAAVPAPPPAAPLNTAPPLTAPPSTSAPTVATAAPVAVENKCPSCATVNPPTQSFCGQCGTRLTRAA